MSIIERTGIIEVDYKMLGYFIGLTLNLLTTTIIAPPSNASKWQMGFNSSFKGLRASGLLKVNTEQWQM
jgi:hypothetical protein